MVSLVNKTVTNKLPLNGVMGRLLIFFLFPLWVAFINVGCTSKQYFSETEQALDTDNYFHVLDHISAYYPSGVAFNFPGYIIGFEETARHIATNSRRDVIFDKTVINNGFTVKRLTDKLKYNVPFISHIIRYEGRPFGEGNCSLYNLYYQSGSNTVNACHDAPLHNPIKNGDFGETFTKSWDAVDIFRDDLTKRIAENDFTHLIVVIMGLDTAQEEAIRNYTSIISSIRKQGGVKFKPLVIGITWSSFYANRWFDPLWEVFAYMPVADRADILGLSWLGVLFNEVLKPLGDRIKITVIGHSFGARAASMGLCVGPAIIRDSDQKAAQPGQGEIHKFIGLAPAFSLRRFANEDNMFYENVFYRGYCPSIEQIILTASSNDNAFKFIFWSDAAGEYKHMVNFCQQEHPVSVTCINSLESGYVNGCDAQFKLCYIDTSQLMKYTMPGTKGTGHSDIYRLETGRLLWSLIDSTK